MKTMKIIFAVLIGLNMILRIWWIDKKREPMTKQEAIVGLMLDSGLIYLLTN